MPAMPHHYQGLLGAIGSWWHCWQKSGPAPAGRDFLGRPRVALELDPDAPQLRTLAGKWPDSADLMSQRLAALQLNDGANIEHGGDCQHKA